jgi:hypothetical protein
MRLLLGSTESDSQLDQINDGHQSYEVVLLPNGFSLSVAKKRNKKSISEHFVIQCCTFSNPVL